MNTTQIIVTLGGVALSIVIAWFFWFAPKGRTKAAVGMGGVQEVAVTVKGGYTPDVIVVQDGQPVRLRYTRQESSACSEMVLFPAFKQSAKLPEGEEVNVEFTPFICFYHTTRGTGSHQHFQLFYRVHQLVTGSRFYTYQAQQRIPGAIEQPDRRLEQALGP